MTAEGYCIPCKADVPVDADRSCLVDGMVCIPPSYGRRTQRWMDGNWVPLIPKPDGWTWKAPAESAPRMAVETVVAKARTFTCVACRKDVPVRKRGRVTQQYCSNTCKNRALAARRWGKKAVAP